MRRMIPFVLLLGIASVAFGQTWQHYQLTDYPYPGTVRQCGAVTDTLGNIHHFFIAWANTDGALQGYRTYYLRTDAWGHVLTDTVQVDTFKYRTYATVFASVVGDGAHAWCIFSTMEPVTYRYGLYLVGRGIDGEECQPPRLLGYPGGGEGPPSWDLSAAYRAQDSTIHLVGNVLPFYYYRFKTNGDTLIWHRRIDEANMGAAPCVRIGPDGTPWAKMRTDLPDYDTEMIMVKFDQNGDQTVYRPFGTQPEEWRPHDFGIDGNYNFHFVTGYSGSGDLSYLRMDSSFAVVETQVLDSGEDISFSTIRVDTTGNCLFVWSRAIGLMWAHRTADGVWDHPPACLDEDEYGSSFSIVTLDSDRFAFTCQAFVRQSHTVEQLQLYTYGYPPDGVRENRGNAQVSALVAYPNPFGGAFQLELPNGEARKLTLYDVLGRAVWTTPMPRDSRHVSVSDTRLMNLPSGTYFATIQGNQMVVPTKMVHFK
jgi:hypothetical protein